MAGMDVFVVVLKLLELMAEAIQEVPGKWDHICCMVQTTNKGVKVLFTDAVVDVINEFLNVR